MKSSFLPRLLAALVLLLLLPLAASAAEAAFTNRDTELKERADAASATLARLPQDTAVKVVERAGAWTRVQAAGREGFVRMFHLRFPAVAEAESSGGGFLSSLGASLTGQQGNRQANLATTGVRGLSTEDVKNASPDAAALARMQSWRADRAAARRFAHEGKLVEAKVDDPGKAQANGGGR